MRPGRTFKAAQPGGVSSAPIGTEQLDVQMALETLDQIDALLGSGGIVIFDDSVCMVRHDPLSRELQRAGVVQPLHRLPGRLDAADRHPLADQRGRGSDGGLRDARLAQGPDGEDDALRARPGGGDAGVRRGARYSERSSRRTSRKSAVRPASARRWPGQPRRSRGRRRFD